MSKSNTLILNKLHQIISQLNSADQTEAFCRALLSESEHVMLAKRLEVLRLLEKEMSYKEITAKLGVSSATISAVAAQRKSSGFKLINGLLGANYWADLTANKLASVFKKRI